MRRRSRVAPLLAAALVTACGALPAVAPMPAPAVQTASAPSGLRTSRLSTCLGMLDVRVGVQRPAGAVKGDVLFFHGFADRLDNHGPLFEAWTKAGLRVVSFDLPSHGENRGLKNKIDLFSFEELADLAKEVEKATREDVRRPLILAGWSTGGLLAVRMAQTDALKDAGRQLTGMVLFTPGVAVHPLVGEKGFVTQRTLTNNPNPPHKGPISPKSPLLTPVFASKLLANSVIANHQTLPKVPTLLLVAGDDEDKYCRSAAVKAWGESQRTKHGATILGVQYPKAKHELDNEPAPVGDHVRSSAAQFAAAVADGSAIRVTAGPGVNF